MTPCRSATHDCHECAMMFLGVEARKVRKALRVWGAKRRMNVEDAETSGEETERRVLGTMGGREGGSLSDETMGEATKVIPRCISSPVVVIGIASLSSIASVPSISSVPSLSSLYSLSSLHYRHHLHYPCCCQHNHHNEHHRCHR